LFIHLFILPLHGEEEVSRNCLIGTASFRLKAPHNLHADRLKDEFWVVGKGGLQSNDFRVEGQNSSFNLSACKLWGAFKRKLAVPIRQFLETSSSPCSGKMNK
jgi:hypothetical protein